MLSAGAATMLGVVDGGRRATQELRRHARRRGRGLVDPRRAGGRLLGRRAQTTPPIARLLAGAKTATMMPEHRPAAVLVNRLWPLLVSTVAAGAVGFLIPQVSAIATGFAIIWALAWRRQDSAVVAIEERDGVTFYVEPHLARTADGARPHAGAPAGGALVERGGPAAAVVRLVACGAPLGAAAAGRRAGWCQRGRRRGGRRWRRRLNVPRMLEIPTRSTFGRSHPPSMPLFEPSEAEHGDHAHQARRDHEGRQEVPDAHVLQVQQLER